MPRSFMACPALEVDYLEDEQSITWLRRPLHGVPQPIEGAEAVSDLIGGFSLGIGRRRDFGAQSVFASCTPGSRLELVGR